MSDNVDFRKLFEAAPAPYLVLDRRLRIVAVNDSYLLATGRERDELLGLHLFEAFPDNPEDLEATGVSNLRASLEAVLETGKPDVMALQKYDIPVGDGTFEERYWSPINTPVLGDDGTVEQIIHRVEDVTEFVRSGRRQGETLTEAERRRLEEMEADLFNRGKQLGEVNRELRAANRELAATMAQLRSAHEAKDRFLATLSHELRNPLGAITGAAEVLRLGERDDVARAEMLEVIERQSTAMARMTDDLLNATRIAVGKLELAREVIDLRGVVERCAAGMRASITGRTRLRLELPDGPAWIDGDAVRIAQAIDNLLANAVKFTDEAGEIKVALRTGAEEATVEVIDDGCGFDPEAAPRLFEVFEQLDSSVARTAGGIGLGLPIVRGIVSEHGGRVEGTSDGPGRGATFSIHLPLVPAPAKVEAPPAPADGLTVRIVMIEDNSDLALGYERLLRRLGHAVEVAPSGREGVELALEHAPDAVLCDIGLPDMSGYEVARNLRADPRTENTLLVAVSGYGQEPDRARSARAGFDLHLVKPLSSSDLSQALTLVREVHSRR
ncbi:MAG TPA: ATP-binding protein [Solirubrobacterales bacterium]|nr:ATP-binding protein [Solirubrobacterales bacterium]